MKRSTYALFLASLLPSIVACSSSSDGGNGANAGPPPPVTGKPACIISADCPSGQHCDLEQCIQDCNTKDPCTGELTCTPRARCVTAGSSDDDATPSKDKAGALTVSPASLALTSDQTSFDITLSSSSPDPVRYRVAVSGPHLSVAAERGEFTGTGKLTIKVDATKGSGQQDIAGSVKIYTQLGDAVVAAPVHVGITGSYKGNLFFDGGPVSFGQASVALDVIEQHGDITARIDSANSLLFPKTGGADTTGHGSYTTTDGIDVTVSQVLDQNVGGTRNHFGRPLGHKVRFKLKPQTGGRLTGTFEDQIYGLFAEPVTTTGSVSLSYQSGAAPNFALGVDINMPASPGKTDFADPYPLLGWSLDTCSKMVCAAPTNCLSVMQGSETSFAAPLQAQMTAAITSSVSPFDSVPDKCRASLATTSTTAYNNLASNLKGCGHPAPLACALKLGIGAPISDSANATLVGKLVRETVAAPLLVAKDELVLATSDSFAKGLSAEAKRLDNASKALNPIASSILQPGLLEFLRTMNPTDAKGPDPMSGTMTPTQDDTYPAGRAMADFFVTLAAIDEESARVNASLTSATTSATSEQEHALVAYMEAVTLNEILTQWKSAPPTIASVFSGTLSAHDRGFTAARQGATVFGVPAGFVPFVYRVEDTGKGASNFEQMMSIAQQSVAAETAVEGPFIANKRMYETSQMSLQNELSALRTGLGARLTQACGADFKPENIKKDSDWSTCGKGHTGDIGTQMFEIEKAKLAASAASARLEAMKNKIAIDVQALLDADKVYMDDIAFQKEQARQLASLAEDEKALTDAQAAVGVLGSLATVEENPQGFAQAAFGAFAESAKADIVAQRNHIEEQMKQEAAEMAMKLHDIEAQANIDRQRQDLTAATIEIDETLLAAAEAGVKAADMLAQAKLAFRELSQQLAIAQMDPSLDPSYRILRDTDGQKVLSARSTAQNELYLAGSALQYELNMSIGNLDGAVLSATNSTSLNALSACMTTIYNSARIAYGTPQPYATTVSVRQMLGIKGPRKDEVTGKTLTEGEQFRVFLLKNDNLDGKGGVGLAFSTDLSPGNGLWSTDVCNDRLTSVQAQLVGDFLGDNQAQVNVALGGGALLRACDGSDAIQSWSMGSSTSDLNAGVAVVQAGVNTFGDAPANTSLFGQAVARASWKLVIPGGADAPPNADVDLTHVDDIILKFAHTALPKKGSPLAVDLSCLGTAGK